MRIRIYIIDEDIGVRYDDEKRFSPMGGIYPPSVLAVCRDCYIYEGCRNFRKFELLADIDFNEEEEE